MLVACTLAMFVFLIFKLFTFFYFFQVSALDRTFTFYINHSKYDNLYIGKANGFRVYELNGIFYGKFGIF